MTSYPYEQLNGESFQHLSQSLLAKEYPGFQCFPVGQPDGGRDGLVRFRRPGSQDPGFILFQIKFARRELNPSEQREWLLRTLRDELPKIQAQIEEGAERFVLITNVAGTAHQGTGAIDRLDKLLGQLIPIPAIAWWRNDLDRRLDNAWDVKFAYPALFSGTDFLRLVIEASPSEGRERRRHAISAFLAGQFESDREVKFKQAELENDLFELFTDVPTVIRTPRKRTQTEVDKLVAAYRRTANLSSDEVDSWRTFHWIERFELAARRNSALDAFRLGGEARLGAAALLLDRDFQDVEPLVVLEGGPGQGKSTIGQYICQIQRLRFLPQMANEEILSRYSNSPMRVPFKVDLRDLATWISGINPFARSEDLGQQTDWTGTLESFLAALVEHASGGAEFNVSDLQATLASTPALFVLDGLDEVAGAAERQRVVEEITRALARLSGIAMSLQVVVTSRPSPFTNSTALPSKGFTTYSLESLTEPLVKEYAERWLLARGIGRSDADEVRAILKNKLGEAHLRDLSRNPMQLAILLGLIHRRGVSLPDKRTALYDSYVSMFFDREAEKAAIVREHRELLIRIHRYLAWVLQARAEGGSRPSARTNGEPPTVSGNISDEQLRNLLRHFLLDDGSDAGLVDSLFSGMVERVVAIVSRVPGTYEFDVQTLREYFAARHLYETAPYSPAGSERRGTMSERWQALSRNYYWLNVARFYAGCYSEGELSSLIDDLRMLSTDEVFGSTGHAQLLAATLLGDWVFAQRPRASHEAVELMATERGLQLLVGGSVTSFRHLGETIVSDPVARNRLVSMCKELVASRVNVELAIDVIWSVLRPNATGSELATWWLDNLLTASQEDVGRWCVLGNWMDGWEQVNRTQVEQLLQRPTIPAASVYQGLLLADRIDLLEGDEQMFHGAIDAMLRGDLVVGPGGGAILRRLSNALHQPILNVRASGYSDGRQSHWVDHRTTEYEIHGEDRAWPNYARVQQCSRVVQAFDEVAERPLEEWNGSLGPWEHIVGVGMQEFGTRQVFLNLANIGAGVRSRAEKCEDSPDLLDAGRPLVRRARFARLRSGSKSWWVKQLENAVSGEDRHMALLFFATWAGPRTIEQMACDLNELIGSLGESDWRRLLNSVRSAAEVNAHRPWIRPLAIDVHALPESLSPRTVVLLAERCTDKRKEQLCDRFLADYSGRDVDAWSLRADVDVMRAMADEEVWSAVLETVRLAYGQGARTDRLLGIGHRRRRWTLPEGAAREIVSDASSFPAGLVQAAEERCRHADAKRILPVGRVAERDEWFVD